MNIVFHNTKGGVGKTTAATFVAQMLARDYDTKNIRCIDLDNIQYSLHWFMNLRKKNNLDYIQTLTEQSKIDEAIRNKKLINIIDAPGDLDDRIVAVLKYADIIIIPTTSNVIDLRSTQEYVNALDAAGFKKYKILFTKEQSKAVAKKPLADIKLESKFRYDPKHSLVSTLSNLDSYTRFYDDGTTDLDRFWSQTFGLWKMEREVKNLTAEILDSV
jgi:cellulose biosynthesis protein BcsQ